MACQTEINGLPLLTGCPTSAEVILVMNSSAGGNNNGYGVRMWSDLLNCIFAQIVMFTGAQLNGGNAYINTALAGKNLLVYYQGQGYLTYNPDNPTYPSSSFIPVSGGGVQILIPGSFGPNDIFIVTPNGAA